MDIPDPRTRKGENGYGHDPTVRLHVQTRLRYIVRAQNGQRAAETVPGDRNAQLLVGELVHEPLDLRQNLLPGRVSTKLARLVLVGVEIQKAGFGFDGRVGAGNLVGGEGLEKVHQVDDPLEAGDGAPPGDGDVPAAETRGGLVVGNGDVADPVGVLAPHLGPPRLLEEIGQVDVGGGEEVAGDFIPMVGRHPETLEEFAAGETAAPAVLGKRVEVEGVVAGLRHLAVADELGAEERVHRVQQPDPVVLAVDLPPHVR